MPDVKYLGDEVDNGLNAHVPGAPRAIVVADDPMAPSPEVSSRKQRLSDLFTIVSRPRALEISWNTVSKTSGLLILKG